MAADMTDWDGSELNDVLGDFLKSFAAKSGNATDGEWLLEHLRLSLPEKGESELKKIRDVVVENIRQHGEKLRSLGKAKSRGMSRESWVGSCLRSGDQNWDDGALESAALEISRSADDVALKSLDVEKSPGSGAIAPIAGIAGKLRSAPDGVKAAVAGALETLVERGKLNLFHGMSAEAAADIAHIAVENVNIFVLAGTGELTQEEALEKSGDVAAETSVGQIERIDIAQKGWELGCSIGETVLGPIGAAVTGALGAAIGYAAGAEIGGTIRKGTQKIRDFAKKYLLESFTSGRVQHGVPEWRLDQMKNARTA